MTFLVGSIVDHLVSLFTGAVAVPVIDGPRPEAVQLPRYVLVGSDGESEVGASCDREPSSLGPGVWWDETGSVVCSAWSSYGGSDLPSRRAEALSDAEACVASVEADRTLGGLLLRPGATTGQVSVSAVQTASGALVRVTFTVGYRSTIST